MRVVEEEKGLGLGLGLGLGEERQKNLHLERELLERECSHVYDSEREMDCPPTAHGETDPQLQGTTDQQSQTDESREVSG